MYTENIFSGVFLHRKHTLKDPHFIQTGCHSFLIPIELKQVGCFTVPVIIPPASHTYISGSDEEPLDGVMNY